MISHSVSSMLSMPPRDSSRSISPIPGSIVNPLAIASQIPLTEPTSGLSSPPTKSRMTSGCRNAPRTPANSAAKINASDGGTFRIDRNPSSSNGSRFKGVMR